jgi:2-methylisocitrate lyase-like PEP mutase family enzyme
MPGAPSAAWASNDDGVTESEPALRAEHLRALHHRDTPLVLPNAWDAASASAVEAAGFDAVATTSGGVAASLGFADGERTPPEEMFAALARIARAVDVPVTADIESGYGLPPGELAERLVEVGAVGCNLEDTDHAGGGLCAKEAQADRIASLREVAQGLGVDVVVNARVDVFVRQVGEPAERMELALERAGAYRRAGADCVYPILASEDEIAHFVTVHEGPVNAMAVADRVRLSRLRALRVARITFGSALQRRAEAEFRRVLEAIGRSDDDWPAS